MSIFQRFIDQIPEISEKFPHKKEDFTLPVLKSKIKNIRTKYQKAVQAKRKSGFGRVILLYFDECQRIWGGSPSTVTIENGVETSALSSESNSQLDVSIQSSASSDSDVNQTKRPFNLPKAHSITILA